MSAPPIPQRVHRLGHDVGVGFGFVLGELGSSGCFSGHDGGLRQSNCGDEGACIFLVLLL